jgi:hypothetical protein
VTDDYLVKLRETMADPAEAKWLECANCPYRFGIRAWPGEQDAREVIGAMLDGLAELATRTGKPVYGLYMLNVDGEPPPHEDLSARCQLWRPGDDAPLVDGTQLDALKRMDAHACGRQN